ncbi:MAG: hypothetical protein Q9209_004586 [Squamulea sp. 1 TL-2023]
MADSYGKAFDLQQNQFKILALLAGLSLEQRQLFQSLIESNHRLVSSNERMSYELEQMRGAVQLQLELPPQVVLQKPVTLLDACGQVSAFHLDFINSPEAFLAVLKIRFRQHGVEERGLQMLDDSQFVLEDCRGKLDLSKPWTQVLRPSQKVDMSMVFHRKTPPSICPVCRWQNENDSGSAIDCQSCGLYYQRVQELVVDSVGPSDGSHTILHNYNHLSNNEAQEKMNSLDQGDLIDQFRRVQLISAEYQTEHDSEAEASAEAVDRQSNPVERLAKPQSSYFDLIHEALSSSKDYQLSLPQIYDSIEQKHPYYKYVAQSPGWQSSVRHSLKRQPAFREIGRDGRSPVWALVPKVPIPNGRKKRVIPPRMPVQSSAARASPLHLFDMSAALLSHVERNHHG